MSAPVSSPEILRPFWEIVIEKIGQHPEVLEIARQNIIRWRQQGQSAPHRLDTWERLILSAQTSESGRQQLLSTLAGTDEENQRLRDFHPFAGVLTREERRHARELCGYRH